MIIEVSALGGISRKRWDRYLETVGFEEHYRPCVFDTVKSGHWILACLVSHHVTFLSVAVQHNWPTASMASKSAVNTNYTIIYNNYIYYISTSAYLSSKRPAPTSKVSKIQARFSVPKKGYSKRGSCAGASRVQRRWCRPCWWYSGGFDETSHLDYLGFVSGGVWVKAMPDNPKDLLPESSPKCPDLRFHFEISNYDSTGYSSRCSKETRIPSTPKGFRIPIFHEVLLVW